MPLELQEYIAGQIWLCTYPVKYAVVEFTARMTVIRLNDGTLMLHSPCEIDDDMRRALERLGEVAYIIAPGNFHHLHVPSAQAAFPVAKTFICPGIESKRSDLRFDGVLGDIPPPAWADQFDQVLMRGSRWMWEVAFLHRRTKTPTLVDLIELFTDATPEVHWTLKVWWAIMRMWNKAKPAPEYQFGWSNREVARASLRRIMQWDFERIIIGHGDLIEVDARQVAERAWQNLIAG